MSIILSITSLKPSKKTFTGAPTSWGIKIKAIPKNTAKKMT